MRNLYETAKNENRRLKHFFKEDYPQRIEKIGNLLDRVKVVADNF